LSHRNINYIDNLHPKDYAGLYTILKKVIGKAIPLWIATLSPLHGMKWPLRVPFDVVDSGDFEGYAEREGPQHLEDENKWDHGECVWAWSEGEKEKFVIQPNPEPFSREDREDIEDRVDLRRDFSESGSQVIVKTDEYPSHFRKA
jgi:hypothetical protein